ncbi:MAG: UDP-N-acetylmuramoyl-L-alanyl-D-glutamate--2,6-diaminopimelate ligase [Fusobacterium perfoetens]|uniref:UDP-N-acetylmuramoyl-L-alanyl-D-glutamate--2, 6-diaminopimelate ligase n=1 Tax=Fusobacterium perfoetens TaxID=852 RepID=UPI0023F3CABB|nr:UDP-N-acetylmuramoyl-L-alanyl-D-glutamate--2,6-diaminopimelate ligase [Fusobacterium perfoetens]MCI6152965.1 UDP-N-acetylmuramoyl-L-alanyl-D-glutamate--2,6-diaminopimelate ligase [Fusobacterium perfoetens]MDY3237185.1 UDP-N-acetylmuramoyl-L-alanyl-D-glutamate--2,6-diaminopimelate ligase [Fusobacterium perfoetens]
MKIEKLFKDVEYTVLQIVSDEITGKNIEFDSRKIENGDIFIALEGAITDGHEFINKAIENGAKTILVEKEVPLVEGIGYFLVKDLRKKMGIIASNFYDYPQNKLKIVGVTGTNGKTTITYILESILGENKIARIGTVEYKIGEEVIPAPNTTPSSLEIIKICKKAIEKGIKYLVMEVSSHGLDIGRVDMLRFESGIFTNLTLDHLDYHKTMENYFLAKRKLFDLVKDKKNSIINIDDEYGKKYFQYTNGISYSTKEAADIQGKIKRITREGQEVEIKIFDKVYNVNLKLLGRYNLYNLLGAIGAVKILGISDEEIIEKIDKIHGAPGRFQPVKTEADFTIIVDYAHTGDALENILKSINEFKTNRIITVFGCGGDRDKTKRPIMGRIAEKYSDIIVVTSDNPRTEEPNEIIKDIVIGLEKDNHIIEINREKAIEKAVELAQKNDIILIAGKGHENYQIIGREKIHFDDREEAIRAVNNLKNIVR